MADTDDLAVSIGVSMQKLNRQLARVEADFQRTAKRQEEAFRKSNERAAREFDKLRDHANRSLGGIKMPGLPGLGSLGAGLGAALSARELVRVTDTWTDLSSRVGLAVGEMDRAPEVMERISAMARRTYSSLEQTAESYLANATTLRELGLSTEESLNYTEALNNALVVSGAKAQVAASVQDALAKAMALGKLSGDQLNTVIGRGGRVAELLAEELGVTVNQLRKAGQEGKITGAVIDRALRGNLEKLRAEADSMPATIGDAFQLLRNAVLEYVGTADKGVGASEKIAQAMILVADNIDKVVAAGGILLGRVLGPAALVVLTRMSAQFVTAAAAIRTMGTAAGATAVAVNGLKAALALVGGPLGAVIAAVALLPAVTTSSAEKTEALRAAGEGAASALDAFAAASSKAKGEQEGLAGEVSRTTEAILAQSRAQLQAQRSILEGQARQARDALQGGAILDSNLGRAITQLGPAERPGQNFNRYLAHLAPQLRAIREGRGDVAAVVKEMDRLAGAGEEVSTVLAEIDRRIDAGETGGALKEATAEALRLARAIGGFDKELDAIVAAPAGSQQAIDAFRALQTAMREAAQAGEVLRGSIYAGENGLRAQLGSLSAAEIALQAVKEALRGNFEEAQRLIGLTPFAGIKASAESATTAVLSLKEAMEALPKEITARVSGLENATDGTAASAALLRQFEGFRATPYWDSNAYRVGFGSDTITLSDGTIQRVTAGMRVSVEDANRDLTRRIGEFQNVIRGQIGAGTFDSFNPAQQGALTSIAYNYGSLPDRIVAAIRSGNNDSIVTAIASLQDHNGGINRNRRLAEASIFAGNVGVEAAATRQEADAARAREEAARKAAEAEKERIQTGKDKLKVREELIEQAQRQVADAAFEVELIGKTAAEQARLRAIYLLTNEAKAQGIDLNERLAGSEQTYGQVIQEQAAKIGEYVAAQEQRAKAVEDAAEREQFMAQVQQDLKDGLIDSIIAGKGFADVLANVAKMLAKAALQAALFGEGPFASKGGGGGLFGKLFDALFSVGGSAGGTKVGTRAAGGPVSAGMPYLVGERGPELIVPRAPGQVIPNHALRHRGPVSFSPSTQIVVQGSIDREAEARLMRELDRRDARMAAALPAIIADKQARGMMGR